MKGNNTVSAKIVDKSDIARNDNKRIGIKTGIN